MRKRTNALDNLLTARAVDALMNYETVKLFTNENLEVGAYDGYLTSYQAAAVETEVVSAKLNAGQVSSCLAMSGLILLIMANALQQHCSAVCPAGVLCTACC